MYTSYVYIYIHPVGSVLLENSEKSPPLKDRLGLNRGRVRAEAKAREKSENLGVFPKLKNSVILANVY